MDSGRYEVMAELVVGAWEERCAERAAAGLAALPRPLLMHSNLDSVEHIAKVWALSRCLYNAALGGALNAGAVATHRAGMH